MAMRSTDAAEAPETLYKALRAQRGGTKRISTPSEVPAPDPAGKFGVIFADPPWSFETWSKKGTGRSAEQHYSVMGPDELKALPVASWAAKDCALLMWIIDSNLEEALELIKAWGFVYKTTAFTWVKLNSKALTPVTGMGNHTRRGSEKVLLATRGAPRRISAAVKEVAEVDEVVRAARGVHSWKPPEFYTRAMELYAGPYLELFARQSREGWTVWGNETTKFDSADPDPGTSSSRLGDFDKSAFDKALENIELLRGALNAIPSDDRQTWLDILCALNTLEPKWGDAARRIAVWWSQKSPKFDMAGFLKAWGSLNPAREDGITVETIFYRARRNGWVDPRRALVVSPSRNAVPEIESFVSADSGEILRGHPQNTRFAIHKLSICLQYHELFGQIIITGLAGSERAKTMAIELTDAVAIRLRFLIQEKFGFLPTQAIFDQVLIDMAHQNRFHPIRDYLATLAWDGTPRIDTWLVRYAGAEDTPFNRAVSRIFLIAAVRRIQRPGCKFDTMLILESPRQGTNKSQALRLLATRDEWFTDNLSLGADPKEVIEQARGHWIIEAPELSGMATREREKILSFLSRQVDKARPAYGRRPESVPRQFVVCGTTNDTEYLPRDERRVWPVRIKLFDLKELGLDIDQLWAEAAHYESAGDPIVLGESLWPEAEKTRATRTFENPYQSILAAGIGKDLLVPSKRVWALLDVAPERQAAAAKRVGQAMLGLGFERNRTRCDGEPDGCMRGDYYYVREN